MWWLWTCTAPYPLREPALGIASIAALVRDLDHTSLGLLPDCSQPMAEYGTGFRAHSCPSSNEQPLLGNAHPCWLGQKFLTTELWSGDFLSNPFFLLFFYRCQFGMPVLRLSLLNPAFSSFISQTLTPVNTGMSDLILASASQRT